MIEIKKSGVVIAHARNEAELAALLALDASTMRGATLPPDMDSYKVAIQAMIDATAQARNYTDGASLAGYVASTVPTWAAEAAAFVSWRDAVWVYAYAEMAKVLAAERLQPSVETLLGELPMITWPA